MAEVEEAAEVQEVEEAAAEEDRGNHQIVTLCMYIYLEIAVNGHSPVIHPPTPSDEDPRRHLVGLRRCHQSCHHRRWFPYLQLALLVL